MWKDGDTRQDVSLTCGRTSNWANGTGGDEAQSAFARETAGSAYFPTL